MIAIIPEAIQNVDKRALFIFLLPAQEIIDKSRTNGWKECD